MREEKKPWKKVRSRFNLSFHIFFYSLKGFQFISDIGGALGLFMGASILSFVEVFQFLIEILNLLRNKFFAKRDPALTPVTELSFCDPLAGKGEKEKSIGHF